MKIAILMFACVLVSSCASRADVRGFGDACTTHGGLAYVSQLFAMRDAECVDGSVIVPK